MQSPTSSLLRSKKHLSRLLFTSNSGCKCFIAHRPITRFTQRAMSQPTKTMDIGHMRKPYPNPTFDLQDLASLDPFEQFSAWFAEASQHASIDEANAVCLATCTPDGMPSARMVLIKEFGPEGFVLHTHYTSRKGQELLSNPRAALVFYWEPMKRQVRIEGSVVKESQEKSAKYFHSRPLSSQIGSACSNQSKVIASRQVLLDKQAELTEKYDNGQEPMPKPEQWGGFKIMPHTFQFWQGQTTRIHDTLRFRKRTENDTHLDPCVTTEGKNGWLIERLAP